MEQEWLLCYLLLSVYWMALLQAILCLLTSLTHALVLFEIHLPHIDVFFALFFVQIC